jgi:hypothetical protein
MVMPVKLNAIKAASPMANWRHQINTNYPHIEFIFVVERLGEAVVPLLRELQAEFGATRDIKIVAAGLASTCTQKVYRQPQNDCRWIKVSISF